MPKQIKGTVEELTRSATKEEAIRFAAGFRGQYIIGQALYIAIQTMEKVPKTRRENSNIADMRFLMDALFPIYKITQEMEKMKNDKR